MHVVQIVLAKFLWLRGLERLDYRGQVCEVG
jgi:hypothetical protein